MAHSADKVTGPVLGDEDVVQRCFTRAPYKALRVHKLMGNPVAAWQGGRVVWIRPEDIVLPTLPDDEA